MSPESSEQAADSIAKLAADLRRLKLDAGGPTLSKLQNETGVSRSVISEALAGKQLPSERTVASLVQALGQDPTPWLARREDLARIERPTPNTDEPGRAMGMSVRTGALIGIASFLGGALATAAAAFAVLPLLTPSPSAAEASQQIVVETGEDPALTACVDDARVATGDTRADNSLLEIVWSDKCQAGWGRITRYDGLYQGNTVTIAIYPQTADRQEATEHDVQGAYTTLVVRPSRDTLLCAEGSFTVDGKRIDLGDPLCI